MRAFVMAAVATAGVLCGPLAAIAQDAPRRNPPRIIITPNRPAADPYPKPGAAYPGPGHMRDCVGYLEPDPRRPGTVVMPHQDCRWVPGHS